MDLISSLRMSFNVNSEPLILLLTHSLVAGVFSPILNWLAHPSISWMTSSPDVVCVSLVGWAANGFAFLFWRRVVLQCLRWLTPGAQVSWCGLRVCTWLCQLRYANVGRLAGVWVAACLAEV